MICFKQNKKNMNQIREKIQKTIKEAAGYTDTGTVQPEPDGAGSRRQAGSGDRQRGRDSTGASGAESPDEE